MRRAQIFISYRRDDSAGYARAICDELARHFGADRVFIDVDDIEPGQAFGDAIQRSMGASAALLVLIGKRWQGEREGLPPRLFEADDLVRREVATGLSKGLVVIPLLLDGAAMPTEAQLPDDLRALAGRNALEIGNTRFAADIARLVATLRETLGDAAPPADSAAATPSPSRRGALTAGALLAAAAAAGVALWQWRAMPRGAVAARPEVNGTWEAHVEYDWPNARYLERFTFGGEGGELHGSASFLGVARGVLEGAVEAGALRFVTRTRETGADGNAESVHRYRGRIEGGEIRFVMQTEGGSAPHVPVEFVARRARTV